MWYFLTLKEIIWTTFWYRYIITNRCSRLNSSSLIRMVLNCDSQTAIATAIIKIQILEPKIHFIVLKNINVKWFSRMDFKLFSINITIIAKTTIATPTKTTASATACSLVPFVCSNNTSKHRFFLLSFLINVPRLKSHLFCFFYIWFTTFEQGSCQ